MTDTTTPLVFDGHNDVLLRLFKKQQPAVEALFLDGEDEGHLDLPRMIEGRFGGGLFAVYIPSPKDGMSYSEMMRGETYDVPLPPLMEAAEAMPTALAMAAILFRIERAANGRVRVCRTAGEIRTCLEQGVLAMVLHMEGAEAIGPDLDALHVFHQCGLRSLGPVWSRPTIFGHGVPFRFPSTPDTGPGLTDAGKALVRACNDLRIAIDLSHINEQGFRDVAKLSDAPLIATHSNAHAVCPHARNLTDSQIEAIRDSGGMVGLNFATCFIRPDGQRTTDTGLELMLRHLDHLIGILGVDHVGMGSDFDGAEIPEAIGDVAGLPALHAAMGAHGYDETTLRKLCHENWIAVLERTWGA